MEKPLEYNSEYPIAHKNAINIKKIPIFPSIL